MTLPKISLVENQNRKTRYVLLISNGVNSEVGCNVIGVTESGGMCTH